MTARRLGVAGVLRSDGVLLRSMLGLLQGHTRDTWTHADDVGPVDLLISGESDLAGQAALRTQRRARVVATLGDRRDDADLALAHPIRARALAAVLDETSAILEKLPSAVVIADPAAEPAGCTLAELLYSLTHQPPVTPAPASISLDGIELMRVDMDRARVHVSSTDNVIQAATRRGAHPRPLPIGSRPSGAAPQPLAPLLWSIGLAHGHALIAPVRAGDVIVANRWPDFGRLPHRGEHLRLTARLTRRSMSTEQLALSAETSHEVTVAFVNAMLLGGLATVAPSTSELPRPPTVALPLAATPVARTALLSRIRARLGL